MIETIRLLTNEELKSVYDNEITPDFPRLERKPFSTMLRLREEGCYLPYGGFDRRGGLLAYALYWKRAEGDDGYMLLDYLGVVQGRKNEGIGGEMLRRQHGLANEGILIESEAPEGGRDDAIRLRRLGFYERGGCRVLPYDTWIFGVHYKTLLLAEEGRGSDGAALKAHQDIYYTQFTKTQRKLFLRIPYDPRRKDVTMPKWGKEGRTV